MATPVYKPLWTGRAGSIQASSTGRLSYESLLLLSYGSAVATLAYLQGLRLLNGVTADTIYALIFVKDAFSNTQPFLWFLPPPNYFFPDISIVAAGYFLGFDGAMNFV